MSGNTSGSTSSSILSPRTCVFDVSVCIVMDDSESDGDRMSGSRLEHTAGGRSHSRRENGLLVDMFKANDIAEKVIGVLADTKAYYTILPRLMGWSPLPISLGRMRGVRLSKSTIPENFGIN